MYQHQLSIGLGGYWNIVLIELRSLNNGYLGRESTDAFRLTSRIPVSAHFCQFGPMMHKSSMDWSIIVQMRGLRALWRGIISLKTIVSPDYSRVRCGRHNLGAHFRYFRGRRRISLIKLALSTGATQ